MNWTGGLNGPDISLHPTIVIVGPTAVGKSAVAISVALELDAEIIGLDSRQIYRYMSIGTAQPTPEEQEGILHHLIAIRNPDEVVTAGEYSHLVEQKICEIEDRGKMSIVCGGSGLYYRALTKGLFEESASDKSIRERLRRELAENGAEAMLDRLRSIDPDYAEIVHLNNHKRLLRALEIYEITGSPPTVHFQHQETKGKMRQFFTIYLRADLGVLEFHILKRTDELLAKGWIEEVKALLDMGYSGNSHSMDSVGYRLIMKHLDGKLTLEKMVERINIETRQYARKQLKWFDKEPVDLRIDIYDKTKVQDITRRIIQTLP